ncbi:hypothetical protein J7E62_32040 [Variovorax paradoxus]|nr:hypothetical protein [Variovorax paradoxus]
MKISHHSYTLGVTVAALTEGAASLQGLGDTAQAQRCFAESQAVLSLLDEYRVNKCDATLGYCRSRVLADDPPSAQVLDIAVIPPAIHSLGTEATYGLADPRMQATPARLNALFDATYPINRGRAVGGGPAMGRYAGDVCCSGAWSPAAFISCVSARRIAAAACEAPRQR